MHFSCLCIPEHSNECEMAFSEKQRKLLQKNFLLTSGNKLDVHGPMTHVPHSNTVAREAPTFEYVQLSMVTCSKKKNSFGLSLRILSRNRSNRTEPSTLNRLCIILCINHRRLERLVNNRAESLQRRSIVRAQQSAQVRLVLRVVILKF